MFLRLGSCMKAPCLKGVRLLRPCIKVLILPRDEKRQRMWFRCLCAFWELFRRRCEWVKAQVLDDQRMMWICRKHLVAFPAPQRYGGNLQSASSFRLEYPQLEPPPPEVAANGGRFLWDWNSAVVGW